MEILRAFRPGSEVLGNGELAERTGLSRATVTRLAQTLVGTGYLSYDPTRHAYRLGTPVLSLAHAMRSGSAVLSAALPLMRSLAQARRINIALAVADRDEMVYLESVRHHRRVSLRNVVSGQRVPMELTSLGRAYLAVLPTPQREALMASFRTRRRSDWRRIEREIDEAAESVRRLGYCVASWQPEIVAVATPLPLRDHPVHVLNASVASDAAPAVVARTLGAPLLELAQRIRTAIEGPE